MESNAIRTESIVVDEIREILSENFSQNTINRIIVAIRCSVPEKNIIEFKQIREMLMDDFSPETINRLIMCFKTFCTKAYC